jgi:hypothetical protein
MADEHPAEEKSLFALGEVRRVRELDYELEVFLTHNTPQAMLRDLHRPVTDWRIGVHDFERYEVPTDAGRGALQQLKQDYLKSYRIPICDLIPTNKMWKAGWAEVREALTTPWADAPKFGTQYLPAWMGNW